MQSQGFSSYKHRSSWQRPISAMTPPLTPTISSEDLTIQNTAAPFPKYLRAIYPFHPPCDLDTDTVTLPLNQGDIVLVHSVHNNGWADGTLLDTAHRGWLPTNYCEEFDSEPIRMLLNALTNFWDSASQGGDGAVPIVHGHNLTQGLVAGVRYLLVGTDCLNRERDILSKTTGHSSLRRHRKALLSDLAEVVEFFKTCQPTATESFITEDDLSQLVLKTFKIIVRAVKFHDVWMSQQTEQANDGSDMQPMSVPPTPPLETGSFSSEIAHEQTAERYDAQQTASATGVNLNNNQPQQRTTSRNRDSSLRSPIQVSNGFSHRISWSTSHQQRNGRLASSRLLSAHEVFISHLGGFLSIHLVTQTSTEVLVATQQAVNSGRALLTVVEAVWDRGLCKSRLLEQARDAMYTKITQLVFAAQQIFSSPDSDDAEPSTRKELADVALTCVKRATDCVNATKAALELIGDFEFETIEDPMFSDVDFEADEFVRSHDSVDFTMVHDFPLPPDSAVQSPIEEQLTPTHQATKTVSTPMLEEFEFHTPASRLSTSSILQAPPSLTDGSSLGDASPLSFASEYSPVYPQTKQDSAVVVHATDAKPSTSIGAKLEQRWSSSAFHRSESTTNLTDGGSSVGHCTLDADIEEDILRTTYAHELVYNKDGQVSGGTLPALVERLTTSDARPNHIFMASFFLTFRLFTTPEEFAKALVARYQYIGEYKQTAPVVRLRVFNVFKTWVESNWRKEADAQALPIIKSFAEDDLIFAFPTGSARLSELVQNVSGFRPPRSLKSKASLEQFAKSSLPADAPVPGSIFNKHQITLLKSWQQGISKPSITDFEPLEVARQLTLKASALFCAVQPEELLATEWTKKTGSHAQNVRSMSTLSTDLTNLVAESVLQFDEHARRAKVIKHWIKIGSKCLELNNYDSLMAIVCSLNSTPVLRLKKTWDCVGSKAKAAFETFKTVVDCSKNYTNLRQRLATLATPALPFLGVYLTDLTFVEAGNACTRTLPGVSTSGAQAAINFDKHAKTAKIVFELQRFQVPYRLQEIPELQAWLQDQFVQVRCSLDNGSSPITKLYRRSCILEPRAPQQAARAVISSTRIPQLNRKQSDFLNTYFH